MPSGKNIQVKIFQEIEKKIKGKKKVLDEVAKVLQLSTNAAYKRIKGITNLNLDDLIALTYHFEISLDQLILNKDENVLFQFSNLKKAPTSYSEYLQPLLELANVAKNDPHHCKLFYATNELPIHYYFGFKEINHFKYYSWAWSNWGFNQIKNKKLSLQYPMNPKDHFSQMTNVICETYFQIPSIEFLSQTALYNTMQQIKYFLSIGKYEHDEDPFKICSSLRKMLKHFSAMAESGKKFSFGEKPTQNSPDFLLFHNEMIQANNISTLVTPFGNHSFVTFDNPNTLYTKNLLMTDYSLQWFEKLKKGSIALSKSSEKSRIQFFNYLFHTIDKTEDELKSLIKSR